MSYHLFITKLKQWRNWAQSCNNGERVRWSVKTKRMTFSWRKNTEQDMFMTANLRKFLRYEWVKATHLRKITTDLSFSISKKISHFHIHLTLFHSIRMERNTSLRTKSMINNKIYTLNLVDFLRVKQDNNNVAGLTHCVWATNENLLLLILPLFIIQKQLGTIPQAIKENPKNEKK